MDSINRHEQLLRVFHLIDILFGARQPLAIAELKDRLIARGVIDDMSEKNLRRDVEFLGKFGYALKRSRKRTTRGTTCDAWSIQPGRGAEELSPPAVTLPELLSLAVAREFLAPLAGTCYWRGIGQLLAKLERVATPELLDYVAAHRDGLVVHPRPAEAKYRSRTLNAVNRAIRQSLELSLAYTSLADEAPRRITIRPEALVVYEGAIYIAATRAAATGDAAAGIRFFKLDRVADARVTSRAFARRTTAIDELLADSITLFRSPTPARRYRIRVDAARARWACEKPFHPRQRVRQLPDGGVLLDIERAWDGEMLPQLLALGEHVEVLEPADMRDELRAVAERIAARHAGRPARAAGGSKPGGKQRRVAHAK
ncbi:MAG: helix-turn-helix transcriptional regulator [Planctomycetota bacterium]